MQSLFHWITDCLFPPRCAGCGALGADVCPRCLSALKPLPHQRHEHRQFQYVDRLIAATAMDNAVEPLIYAMKYRGLYRVAAPLGDWMAAAIGLNRTATLMFGSNPLIVPVPLHPRRLRERGYNQAALLAQRLAATSAMPLCERALVRARRTGSQVETHSRQERMHNMKEAFRCVRPELVDGKDILLVDDVCTTGATLDDCARAL
jgi:competence protein ComFC